MSSLFDDLPDALPGDWSSAVTDAGVPTWAMTDEGPTRTGEHPPSSGPTDVDELLAGLNPERIMAAAGSVGSARYAIDRAVDYAKQRTVFKVPIGAHQAIAHPLAELKVETELAKLMLQKAATLYDAGEEFAAAEAANMAKFAGGEAGAKAVDRAIHSLGGNGLTTEYGLAQMLVASRLFRIAPVSREMVLNFISEHSLGLPKSY